MRGIVNRIDALRSQDSLLAALLSVGVVLVLAPLIGFALVVASHAIPDSLVREEIERAMDLNQLNEADYGQVVTGRQVDYFTDCVGLSIGLPDEGTASPIRSAIAVPTGGGCSSTVPSLREARSTGDVVDGWDYFRYWHGYTTLTRPSVAAFGLAGTRILAFVGLFGLAFGLARSVSREHGRSVAAVLLGPLLLTTDLVDLPRSLPHAVGAGAALGLAWYVHHRTIVRGTLGEIGWVSAVAGAAFLYFDILTMPPGAAMLTVGTVGLGLSSVATGARLAAGMVTSLVAWSTAWVWMWVAKWVIAATVFGVGTVADVVRSTAENRLDGNAGEFDFSLFRTSHLMLGAWKSGPLTMPLLVAVSAVAIAIVVMRWRRAGSVGRYADRLLLASPAGIAFVWFEIMRNHSQQHGFFTYRSLAISAGLAFAAAIVALPRVAGDDPRSRSTAGMTTSVVSDGSGPPDDSEPHTPTATDPMMPSNPSGRSERGTRPRLDAVQAVVRVLMRSRAVRGVVPLRR